MAFGITNTDNVDTADSPDFAHLNNARAVEFVEIGGNGFIYVGGSAALIAFSIDQTDGSLDHIETIDDNGTLKLNGLAGSTSAVVGGTTYLFTASTSDSGVSVFSVNSATGVLTNTDNVSDDGAMALLGATNATTAVIGGTTYLFVASQYDDGVAVFSVSALGILTHVESVFDNGTLRLDAAADVATAVVGGTTYLFASGYFDGVSVFSVNAAGHLVNVDNEGSGYVGLQVEAVTVGGSTYLISSKANYDGLTVFGVDTNGQLTSVFEIPDDTNIALDTPVWLKTKVLGGITYLFVASYGDTQLANSYGAISVWAVNADGSLTSVADVYDEDAPQLQISLMMALAVGEDDGTPYVAGIGFGDAGISLFELSPPSPPAASNLTQTKAYAEDAVSVALDDIVVTDPDVGEIITATLTLSNPAAGALTISGTAIYTAGTGIWTITDTVTNVNAALAAVSFTPAADYDVNSTITTHIQDAANTGPANGSITLDVTPANDAPGATNLTNTKAYTEGASSVALDDIVVTEVDTSPAQSITATLTLTNIAAGALTISGAATYTAGTGVWTVTGTVAQVNAALAAVAFVPATNNDVDTTITTHIQDQNSAGPTDGAITLDVTPVNDAPAATNMTQTKAYTEGASSVALDDIVVSEVDTSPAQSITATLTLSNTAAGALTISGAATYTAGTGVWTITDTVANVNAALAAVAFVPVTDNDVDATITTHIQDQNAVGPIDGAITLDVTPVNDAPAATNMTQTKAYTEGASSVALDDIVVSEVDTSPAQSITATLTLLDTAVGVLTTSGTATYTSITGVWTVTGTVAQVNAALAAVAFTPSTNNDVDATITTHVVDQNAARPADGTITLDVTAVNDPPAATNLTQTKAYTEGAVSVALDDIEVIEVDTDSAQTITATLTLTNTAAGALTISGAATYTAGTGVWTITGTAAEVYTALAAVAFVPVANNDVDATITTHVQDQNAAAPVDGVITLDVTPVNDAPAATNLTQSKAYTEGDASVALDDIVVSEVDTSPAQSITATLTLSIAAAGALTTSGAATYTAGTGVWTITGTVSQVNAALAAVAFTPATDNDADATITTHIQDQNAAGPANGAITLDVTGVNDAPVVGGPVTLAAIAEDSGVRLITQAQLLANTTDIDGPALAASGLAISSGLGSLVDNGNGSWNYTPAADDDTSVSFTYSITDGVVAPVSTSATLDITPQPEETVIPTTPGNDSVTAGTGNERADGGLGNDTITFNFRLLDATFTWVGNQVIIDSTSSHTVTSGFETFIFTDGTVNTNDADVLVDDLFYYARNHDVWAAHADADQHYHTFGWHEARDPNAFFSTSLYLSANADVRTANVDPLTHYHQFGWGEHRAHSIAFDDAKYLQAYADVAAVHIDPLAHFLDHGAQEARQPFAMSDLLAPNGFDYVYYLQNNPDVAAAHVDPFLHFQTVGWQEGRNPNALFNTAGYLATYTDVANAHVNPLNHYNTFGWHEGRDPSVGFDTTAYLAAYPDVAAANVNPLSHYLHFGILEGRSPFADGIWG